MNGNEMIRNGALHGLRIAVVMCDPNLKEGDVRMRWSCLSRRITFFLSLIQPSPVQFWSVSVMLLSCWWNRPDLTNSTGYSLYKLSVSRG